MQGDAEMLTTTHFSEEEDLGVAREWVEPSEKGPGETAAILWDDVTYICAPRYGIQRGGNGLRAFWKRIERHSKHWLAAKKVALATMSKTNEMTPKNSTILHATQILYRRRSAKAASRDKEARRDSDSREISVGSIKFIRAADYLKDQPKFRSVAGSWKSNEGHRAMDAERQVLSMRGASQQRLTTRESTGTRAARKRVRCDDGVSGGGGREFAGGTGSGTVGVPALG